MQNTEHFTTFQNLRLISIVTFVGLLLLIPLVAMRFTNEVNWTLLDFSVAGFLLLSAGLSCELVMRKVKSLTYRIVLCAAILGTLVLIWGAMVAD